MERQSPYYTVPEACVYLRMGKTRLYAYIRDGHLPVTHWGRAVRIHRDDLARFEHEQRSTAQTGDAA